MATRFLFFATLSVLLCHLASINHNNAMAVVLNINTDQSSLLVFRDHISYHKILTKNWSTSFPVCNWVGVTCGSSHHRVTALNLSYMGLAGTIPPHLGNLSFLSMLDLRNNSFQGSLPNEVARLHRLKLLRLSYNKLNGEIPSGLASFPKLEVLSLGYNSFTGIIPSFLFNTTMLQRLHLGGNMFTGFLPSNVLMAPALEYLVLDNNQISGSIPPIIFNHSSLQFISLKNNNLVGELPKNIFHYLPKLEALDISDNHLSGGIPSSLFNCKQLQSVWLSSNNFTGNIPPEIGNSTMLKYINLDLNSLQGLIPNEIGNLENLELTSFYSADLRGHIPSAIFNISTIKAIHLTGNHLGGSLPSTLGFTLPNLEQLLLGINNITGKIPSSLSNATMLSHLDLGFNSIFGNIPDIFRNLSSLRCLILAVNSLIADPSSPELSIIDSLKGCTYLIRLDLSYNPLNSVLPISIGNLSTSLEFLSVCMCNMRGNIPANIGNLSGLLFLELAGNQLTGTIPTGIGRLQQLQRFNLYDSKLKGPVPHEICQIKRLGLLYLGSNRFSGPIPSCLGNLTSLRKLSLDSNTFNLTIPSTLWSLSDLLILNLSSNELRGALPLEISNLKVVTELSLDKNQLSGNIPSSIGGLQNLKNLSLAQNEFEGPIPKSFGNLVSLESLDLSENNLTGVIPTSLEALVYLSFFNVSFNNLEGQIPSGGHFANFSTQSFMGNEKLCGAPHLQFPECKTGTLGKTSKAIAIVLKYIIPTAIATVLILAFIYVWRCPKKNELPNPGEVQTVGTWKRISYYELRKPTNEFRDFNLLGIGSFGKVYKGTLSDGQIVAVKVFNLEREGAFKSYEAECEVLCHVRHRNLIKIISSCSMIDFKALVLNYMSNGCLEKWLHSYNHSLTFIQRLNIMIDVAEALDYLHYGCSTPIVHCNLKPSNVLLDDNMVAHVTDFGIARLFGGDSITQTMTLATMGYMAPEYGLEGMVSRMVDVYSYGILLVETFTQKKPRDEMFQGEYNIIHWVKESYPDAIINIIDPKLLTEEEGPFSVRKDCLSSIMGLALNCSAESPHERTINDVIVALKKIKMNFE